MVMGNLDPFFGKLAQRHARGLGQVVVVCDSLRVLGQVWGLLCEMGV